MVVVDRSTINVETTVDVLETSTVLVELSTIIVKACTAFLFYHIIITKNIIFLIKLVFLYKFLI